MATTNYGLEEINKQTDIISPDPINRNMVKIDSQMKTNELAIQSVSQQVAAIDVTTNVEEVVNRRVNSDRLKPLNTFMSEVKEAIVSAITSARDNIKTHVTSEHTTTKTKINTDIIGARDSVNANVDAEATSIRSAIADLKQHVSNGKNLIATAITNKGISATSSDTLTTLASKISQLRVLAGNCVASRNVRETILSSPVTRSFRDTYKISSITTFSPNRTGTIHFQFDGKTIANTDGQTPRCTIVFQTSDDMTKDTYSAKVADSIYSGQSTTAVSVEAGKLYCISLYGYTSGNWPADIVVNYVKLCYDPV